MSATDRPRSIRCRFRSVSTFCRRRPITLSNAVTRTIPRVTMAATLMTSIGCQAAGTTFMASSPGENICIEMGVSDFPFPLLSDLFVSRPITFWNAPWSERLREGVNLLGVEDLLVALEQAGDGGAVNLHLRPADTDGSVGNDVIALHPCVGKLDPLDAQWRHRVEIDQHAQGRTGLPGDRGQQTDAGGPGGDDEVSSCEGSRKVGRPRHGDAA